MIFCPTGWRNVVWNRNASTFVFLTTFQLQGGYSAATMRTSICTIFLFYQGNNIEKSINGEPVPVNWSVTLFLYNFSQIAGLCLRNIYFCEDTPEDVWVVPHWNCFGCLVRLEVGDCLSPASECHWKYSLWGFTWKSCMGLIFFHWSMNIVILDKNEHSYAVDCFFSGVHGIGIELNADCTNYYDIVLINSIRFY